MRFCEIGPDDDRLLRDYCAVANAAEALRPYSIAWHFDELRADLRMPRRRRRAHLIVAYDGDAPVAIGGLSLPQLDNLDAAEVETCVADVIAQLEGRCRLLPPHDDPAIEQYVTAAFAEARR